MNWSDAGESIDRPCPVRHPRSYVCFLWRCGLYLLNMMNVHRLAIAAAMLIGVAPVGHADEANAPRIAVFSADVTVSLGHGMMGGAWQSKRIADPLEAHGFVLLTADKPIVFVSVDWCEIRNEAYAQWQRMLAEAAGTDPHRVLVTAVHQHDAPVADLDAESILRQHNAPGSVCDPAFHEKAVRAVADALKAALPDARPLTHLGVGQARVDRIASNRRYVTADGSIRFDRTSRSTHAPAIEADEGLIDPNLKTVSFWHNDTPLAAVSFYAVHPMSHYGQGDVSADFPGLARRKRQRDLPQVHHIYCTGAAGNITAGKYNNGDPANRPVLADRLYNAMVGAWQATVRAPVERITFRAAPVRFEPRSDDGFTPEALKRRLTTDPKPFNRCLAAMGLSWRNRLADGNPVMIPAIDFGQAAILLLPGEAYVEYQLAAQRMRPDHFIAVAGYGDAATGYIPTEQHWREHDPNLGDWCWVAPGAEARLLQSIREALGLNAR